MTSPAERLFHVAVAMTANDGRTNLLATASVLHRRGVKVVEADIARAADGRQVFSATFNAEPRRAFTLLKSFENLANVVDARLVEAFDSRDVPVVSAVHTDS